MVDDLLNSARNGDQDAFAQLREKYHSQLLRYLRAKVGYEDAEDVGTDIWEDVRRKLPEFDDSDGRAFERWFATIKYHACVDYWRTKKKDKNTVQYDAISNDCEESSEPSPESSLATKEALLKIEKAIEKVLLELKPEQRDVIRFWAEEHCTAPEVAKRFHWTEHRVRGVIRVFRQKLKKELENDRENAHTRNARGHSA
jgi:RNA polymerase sigma factor (sigma-70 family)